jgi:hypothetical protein
MESWRWVLSAIMLLLILIYYSSLIFIPRFPAGILIFNISVGQLNLSHHYYRFFAAKL